MSYQRGFFTMHRVLQFAYVLSLIHVLVVLIQTDMISNQFHLLFIWFIWFGTINTCLMISLFMQARVFVFVLVGCVRERGRKGYPLQSVTKFEK